VLGYLGVDRPLAGQIELDRERAVSAVAELAAKVGMGTQAAAAGIVHIAEMHMADLIRKVTIHRGFDPSEFVLLAYGGGGPVHAGAFGAELGVRRILVPLGDNSSLWSALGAAASDVRRVFEVSRIRDAPVPVADLAASFGDLERRGRDWLVAQGFSGDAIELSRHVELRYKAQVNQVSIPVRGGELGSEAGTEILESFERAYAGLYGEGTGYRAAGIELTSLRVDAVGRIERPSLGAGLAAAPVGESSTARGVWWSELQRFVDTAVYEGEALRPGGSVSGPAIVEFIDTTLVVHPGQSATADELGNVELVMES
jgi:N-methylhydantoinase A